MADHLDCCPMLGRFPHSLWLLPVHPICTHFPLLPVPPICAPFLLLPVPPICTPFPLHLTSCCLFLPSHTFPAAACSCHLHTFTATSHHSPAKQHCRICLKHCFSPSERLLFCTERPKCGSLLTTSRSVTWLPSSSVLVLSHLSFGSVQLLADKP
jgi:hypothetical protein